MSDQIATALSFVKSAVAKKDFVPVLQHFDLAGDTVTAFNGNMALHSPIPVDIRARPEGKAFVSAINAASSQEEPVALHLTKAKRLAVIAGKFKAYVNCIEVEDDAFPAQCPEGDIEISVDKEFYTALKTLAPIMGVDASRPWSAGIMLKGGSAFVTNNIILVEYHHGITLPCDINIPDFAVKEMIRIGCPDRIQISEGRSMTVHYPEGRWLRTQLLSTNWPDKLSELLEIGADSVTPYPNLAEPLITLKPFLEDTGYVFFSDNHLRTTNEDLTGAGVDVEGIPDGGCFHHSQLTLLSAIATHADFTPHPDPCPFYGDRLRGLIIGLRV